MKEGATPITEANTDRQGEETLRRDAATHTPEACAWSLDIFGLDSRPRMT